MHELAGVPGTAEAIVYCGGPVQTSNILLDLENLFSRPPRTESEVGPEKEETT